MNYALFLIILSLSFNSFGQSSKNWKNLKTKTFDERNVLCGEDLYKEGTNQSPLMSRVIGNVNQALGETSTMNFPALNWKKTYVQRDVLRGGVKIFSAMADLIRHAEKEVLIQTFIFNYRSDVAQKFLFPAILDLYKTHEMRIKSGKTKDPVVVRLIFDIIGGPKGLNLNELFINSRFEGEVGFSGLKRLQNLAKSRADFGEDADYEIAFPEKPILDPKVMRFEIKGHRHDLIGWGGEQGWGAGLTTVTHSKSLVVDRNKAVVTGANIIDYHMAPEMNTPLSKELMVDHGFIILGNGALMAADDFYNLWYKKKETHRKWSGFSTQYNGNVKADEYLQFNGQFLPGTTPPEKLIPFLSKYGQFEGNVLAGIAGRESSRGDSHQKSPQNAAFLSVLANAKSHVNITSPSLNSKDLMNGIVDAVIRGVDVNFLLSQHYQDYNFHLQEGGSNQMAVETIFKDIEKKKKSLPENLRNKVGSFNLKWFVTRGGNTSGRPENTPFKFQTRVTEKFWNHNHTKFLSADNQVLIVGSANFDQQSFYNSRELNFVLDSHNLAQYWCQKVFATDFQRGDFYGSKLSAGERCMSDSQCDENKGLFCNNNVRVHSWYKDWRCVHHPGRGLGGSYCENNLECKSNSCIKNKCAQ